jgi:alkylhydroperoxidase family enzyme
MPRIPYMPADLAEPADVVDAIRNRRGGSLNVADRMVLNAPNLARGWNALATVVRGQLSLPARLRELAICTVGVLNGADFEVEQHLPVFVDAGGSLDTINEIRRTAPNIEDATLDPAERVVVRLSLEMTRGVRVSDENFNAAELLLENHQQLVELIATIAFYNMVARFLVALEVTD